MKGCVCFDVKKSSSIGPTGFFSNTGICLCAESGKLAFHMPGITVNKCWVFFTALSLAACVEAPPTAPPQIQIAPQRLGLGSQTTPRLEPEWWRAFGDPQLDRLVAQLLAGNPTLQSTLARIRAAQAELSVARTSTYPNINIDATENRELLSNSYLYPQPLGGSWQWVGDAEARLKWSLDFWGKQAALIEQARSADEAVALDASAAKLALAGQFSQSYVDLGLAWQNIDIARLTVAERQTILDLTQTRFAAGLRTKPRWNRLGHWSPSPAWNCTGPKPNAISEFIPSRP